MTGTLAHGIGDRQDLPLPFSYVLLGAGLAVLVSFLAVGVLWREPRLGGVDHGRALPAGLARALDAAPVRLALRALGLVVAGYAALAAVLGPPGASNPTAGVAYVLLWVGVPLLSLVVGPFWRTLNPLRTLHLLLAAALRTRPDRGVLALPDRLGYWPAAVGLLAFVWLELVAPDQGDVAVVRTWFLLYAACHLVAAAAFGSRWFDRAESFEAFSALLGRLAPLGRREDGVLVLRNPLDGLAGLPPAPGLTAVVVVLLGGTAYDSVTGSPSWQGFVQQTPSPTLAGTLALLAVCVLVGAVFLAGALGTAAVTPAVRPRTAQLPGELAHTLVPIVAGYFLAHYYSLLVLVGQETLVRLSDPLGTGADWLGTGDLVVDSTLVTPTGVAVLQVAAIVTGHVLGVIAAHDRAMRLLPRRTAVLGQVPLLLLMVAYTVGGLVLLFAA